MTRAGNSFRLGRPRHNPTPSEPYVYHALADGLSIDEVAFALGINRSTLVEFIRLRRERWAAHPPGRLVADERRILVSRQAYTGHSYRTITISLPRISMHVAVREEARRHG